MVSRYKIDKIEFKMLSPQMIKKMAVVKVVTPELYDADGYPIDGSLMDLRMGVVDPGLRCRTCGGTVHECPGHFGYIELARPVFHIKYVDKIYDFLRCTCHECGRITLNERDKEKFLKKMERIKEERGEFYAYRVIDEIVNKAKNARVCPYCGAKKKKVKFQKPYFFFVDGKRLTPVDVRAWLEKVPDEDAELLGISPEAGRPEWMVLTLLPIPPVSVRPSITLETGERSEDDLTHKLGDIVRTNQRLFENLTAGAPEIIIEDLWDLLQYHVATLFVNNIAGLPPARHRSGRPLKVLSDRLRGKEGRFRHNLAGKRVNFSARTVISPDPLIGIDEVGVPLEIAKELTVPVRVTQWNMKYVRKFVENWPEYPSANYVITPDGRRKKITPESKQVILEELAPGYIVERHLMNGDYVLFNRQPSLHRMSIMAHRVRILPGRTFRLNVCATIPYNADFDGDEMNLHVPQTEEAMAEARFLLALPNHIITPRYGLPIIGAQQDTISGIFLLTRGERKLTREEAAWLLANVGIYELPGKKKEFTGKEIFSMILPDIDYEGQSSICKVKRCATCKKDKCPYDAYVVIKKGKLIKGTIDAKAIGAEAGKGKLLHEIVKKYGNEKAIEFLDKLNRLGLYALQMFGFTVPVTDTDLPPQSVQEIKNILALAERRVNTLIEKYRRGEIEAYPGRTLEETLEIKILEMINRARNQATAVMEKHYSEDNFSFVMALSGARGGTPNLLYMSAFVGQVQLRGGRIKRGFTGRTLSHFKPGDIGLRARGFIRHSYKAGIDPIEFFFNAITGRDSMMDTSMRTPKSGYMQRRLINALQDLRVEYDKTVRDSRGVIVQFLYGEDGIDVSKSDNGTIAMV